MDVVKWNFETEDVMLLLDARRLYYHQLTEKSINSQETKKKMLLKVSIKDLLLFLVMELPGEANEITVVPNLNAQCG